MRALVIALLAMMHLAGVAWSDESVVSGDSDHEYLPVLSEREVLLHEFTWNSTSANPGSYLAWNSATTDFNSNCFQQYNAQGSAGMEDTNRACTLPENAFRAPRMFRLTRVLVRTGTTGTFASDSWAQSIIRVATVSTAGTITGVGTETSFESGVGTVTKWDLAVDVPVGTGVALQLRKGSSALAFDDIGSLPTVEIWGIWK